MRTTTRPRRALRRGIALSAVGALIMALAPATLAAAQEDQEPRGTDRPCPDDPETYPDFEDIEGSAHELTVRCMADYGLTRGLSGGEEYGPRRDVTRGQMASFIARFIEHYIQEELDQADFELEEREDDFSDVPEGYDHHEAIHKLAEIGVTRGTSSSDGEAFAPQKEVTRAQMASFISRGLSYIENETSQPEHQPPRSDEDHFPDDDGSTHEENIDALAAAGIVVGYESGDYGPGDPVKRDQMASFVMRGYDFALETELGVSEVVSQEFTVPMSWANEVDDSGELPVFGAGEEPATGEATITLTTGELWNGTAEIEFSGQELSSAPQDVGEAGPLHLHQGTFAENGDVVVPFLDSADEVTWSEADGTAEASATVEGVDNDLLFEVMDAPEEYYVNYHTADHTSPGAIRGQLFASGQDGAGAEGDPEAVFAFSGAVDTVDVLFDEPIGTVENADGFEVHQGLACEGEAVANVNDTSVDGQSVTVSYDGALGETLDAMSLQVAEGTVADEDDNTNPESDCLPFVVTGGATD